MKRILAVCGLGVMALTASAAHAEMSVETARANLNKTRSLMIARMRLVLSPEQRRKIADMLPAGGGWGIDRGPARWGWGGFWRH